MALGDKSVVYDNVTEYLATGHKPSGSSKSHKAFILTSGKKFLLEDGTLHFYKCKGYLPQGNLRQGNLC